MKTQNAIEDRNARLSSAGLYSLGLVYYLYLQIVLRLVLQLLVAQAPNLPTERSSLANMFSRLMMRVALPVASSESTDY
jgi:hypothetical protein